MITQLPPRPHLAAAYLAGLTRQPGAGAARTSGVLVLKASFNLLQTAAVASRLSFTTTPSTGPAGVTIAYADETYPDQPTDPLNTIRKGQLRYEADVALEKAWTDVVVTGWIGAAPQKPWRMEGRIRVNGNTWLQREAFAAVDDVFPGDPDARIHLFGWQPRGHKMRSSLGIGATEDDLPDNYTPEYHNAYRRGTFVVDPDDTSPEPAGPAFTAPRLPSAGALQDGSVVRIGQWPVATSRDSGPSATWIITLSGLSSYHARLRAYCGHGPDRRPYWKIVDTIPLSLDTFIVGPANKTAVALWRAQWDFTREPAENWRLVQVLEGAS